MATSDVSDGEIVEDLSEISSEDDYFENLKKLAARKLELELQNTIAFGEFTDYGKENKHLNNRKRPSTAKKRIKSGSRNESSRQEAKRNRSYRASSVFSNYAIHKRKKTRRSHRHIKRPKQNDETRSIIMLSPNSEEESSDEELLQLRLTALKSKLKSQEVRELIDGESLNEPEPEPAESNQQSNEEDQLRIMALKSAVLKKKEFFKQRKKMRKMENERPYSPSEDLTPIIIDDDDAMVLSPLGSPFNEIKDDEQEIDMDISNSPMNEEKESSDMDTSPSPSGNVNIEPAKVDENEEETALRSLLLTSIHKKKDVEKSQSPPESTANSSNESVSIAQNLKLAVQRLKEKKKLKISAAKSGTKTIAMILEENKSKKTKNEEHTVITIEEEKQAVPPEEFESCNSHDGKNASPVQESILPSENNENYSPKISEPASSSKSTSRNYLFRTITNDLAKLDHDTPDLNKSIDLTSSPNSSPIEPDSLFSTITDTKNIPLLSETAKTKRSRLITPLEFVTRPVSRLVIEVRADSETDDEIKRNENIKKTTRKIIRAPEAISKSKGTSVQPEFEKNLDSFLKNIRLQQENVGNEKKTTSKIVLKPQTTTTLTKALSSVKHLPLSSQIEYEQLLQKMKVLEEAKLKRLKARQLKRTKSNTGCAESAEKPTTVPQPVSKASSPKKPIEAKLDAAKKKSSEKITDSLSKIPQLDQAAQQRLIEKTEINFKNHSNNLINATRQSIKLLEDNEVEMKKQEKLANQIVEIERMLKKYKNNHIVVSNRVKSNVLKIVQSQREMIKLRNHQKRFGEICQQVGSTIRGGDYSLPDHQLTEIEENFTKIAMKTEDVVRLSSDQHVKTNMKLIADRVKSFVTIKEVCGGDKIIIISDEIISCAKEIEPDSSAVTDLTPVENIVEEESEVSRMLNENVGNSVKEQETAEVITFPEVQKQTKEVMELHKKHSLRLLGDQARDQSVVKKLKYESPLEFLRQMPKIKYESRSIN